MAEGKCLAPGARLSEIDVSRVAHGGIENFTDFAEWKMNLIAMAPDNERLYVAIGHEVQERAVLDSGGIGSVIRILSPPSGDAEHPINQIRCSSCGASLPVLVTVDDAGCVAVFFVNEPDRKPLDLQNALSTWGLAISPSGLTLGVSANSFKITLWELADSELPPMRRLEGHEHNIPCIDFSPDGRRLASCSIDCSVRIWDVTTGRCLIAASPSHEWGWAVRWLRRADADRAPMRHVHGVRNRQPNFPAMLQDFNLQGMDPDALQHIVAVLAARQERVLAARGARDAGRERMRDVEELDGNDEGGEEEEGDVDAYLHQFEDDDGQAEEGDFEEFEDASEGDFDGNIEAIDGGAYEDDAEDDGEAMEVNAEHEAYAARDMFAQRLHAQQQQQRGDRALPGRVQVDPASHDLLIYASARQLFLLDGGSLRVLDTFHNLLPIHRAQVPLLSMARLALMEWIPEACVLAVGSQGGGQVALISVLRAEDRGVEEFALVRESIIPEQNLVPGRILCGMSVAHYPSEIPTLSYAIIHLVYSHGLHMAYEVRRDKLPKQLDPMSWVL